MTDDGTFTIDCGTCIATGTTACNECVVTDLLASDDRPIELAPARSGRRGRTDRIVDLFRDAGLIDDDPVWVAPDEFEDAAHRPRAR